MFPTSITPACTVIVIDIQERLLQAMDEVDGPRVAHNTQTLVELAHHVGANVVYSEQYPRGLGPTEATLLAALEEANAHRIEKTHFDLLESPNFNAEEANLQHRVILCGMETHICVLSTAKSLLARHNVLVPLDAVLSRTTANRDNGLAQMEKAGALITNTETLVFGTLGHAKHPEFKYFSKRIK